MLVIAIPSHCFRAISINEPGFLDGKLQQVCRRSPSDICRRRRKNRGPIEFQHRASPTYSNISKVGSSNEVQHDTRRASLAGSSCAIENVHSLPQWTSALWCSNREGFCAIARTSQCWMDLQLSSGNTFEMPRRVLQHVLNNKWCHVAHQSTRQNKPSAETIWDVTEFVAVAAK